MFSRRLLGIWPCHVHEQAFGSYCLTVLACVQCPIAVLSWSFHSLSSSMTSRKALVSSKLAECHSRGGFVELFIHLFSVSMERDLEFLLHVITLHLGSVTLGQPPKP